MTPTTLTRAAFVGLGGVFALAACAAQPTPTPRPACPTEAPTNVSAQATLEGAEVATLQIGGSVEGEIVIELLDDAAPLATASFVALARCGFYDGVTFHRVIDGFVIQAGDPQTRTNRGDFDGIGTGGPGYDFEIEPPAEGLRYDPYTVAMANNTVANGSQFFIDLVDLDQQLRQVGVYTIFGQVIDGTDTVDAIAAVPVNEFDVPFDAVIIESITISAAPTPSATE
jgi:cyclophilin family peptidyl-prolyl cis-trans isomerase